MIKRFFNSPPMLGIFNFLIRPYVLITKKVILRSRVRFDFDTHFEGHNKIYDRVFLHNCNIRSHTFIGPDSILINSSVGRFCSIGPRVKTIIGRHPTKMFVSTHPAFFSLQKQNGFTFVTEQKFKEYVYADDRQKMSVKIGNDVWIGADAMIFEGVTIGDGAIIGAGSLVNKSIEPYSIYAGNPLNFLRKRFDEKDIELLLKIKWWDRDITWVKANCQLFSNISDFLENVK